MDQGPDIAQIDACRYQLHFPTPVSTASHLNLLAADILTFVQSLASTYIWHKQAFNLAVSTPSLISGASEEGLYLKGKIDCTDCVDDEWFTVWLLQEISRAWPEVVIGVEDEDGEFLLIEAAEVLPKWVTPQNATNRVSLVANQAAVLWLTSFTFDDRSGSIEKDFISSRLSTSPPFPFRPLRLAILQKKDSSTLSLLSNSSGMSLPKPSLR